ncbi:carbamoyltransferase C-terminal domain-containing protein [Bacillus cereus]|uniref:carbamoyltransferase C-terminal domain-containing protein n=1 Tax=Bacillus cereus TaxID=1396 RepID=UPI0018794CF3|nr:carbamoyltransferase C-terminal domain-containing protein [Bacillus cereus]MBE7099152.1 nodulation protein-related protein [Bacillus cereus]
MSNKDIYVLGVSMSNHDRSAALLKNGVIISAIGEERIDRRKKSDGFYGTKPNNIVIPPFAAITYVLKEANIGIDEIDLLVCGRSITSCKKDILQYIPICEEKVVEADLPSHHLMHAYSAFGTCPFDKAAVLVLDEQGHRLENGLYEKISMYKGTNNKLEEIRKTYGNKQNISLGMFFDIFASLIGLSEAGVPSAGKLMGLAPYGKHNPEWKELIEIENGDLVIDITKIDEFLKDILPIYSNDVVVSEVDDFLKKYTPVHWNTELGRDIAYKAQSELTKAVEELSFYLFNTTGCKYLCYAGGIALNCTANSKLMNQGWKDIFIQPAATDDGIAIGLCQYGWIEIMGGERIKTKFNPFLGKDYTSSEIIDALEKLYLSEYSKEVEPVSTAAEYIQKGKIVCWFQGASEWGPRALGSRSILANPLEKSITEKINKKVKFRERFRPFGISVIEDDYHNLFVNESIAESLSLYMLNVVQAKDILKEVRHIDGTIRFQKVDKEFQPIYYSLIKEVGKKIGVNAVLNTSFNVMGEPLVETPENAIRQFFLSGADVLIIGDICIDKDNFLKDECNKIKSLYEKKLNINLLDFALSLEAADFEDEAVEAIKRYQVQDAKFSEQKKYHSFCLRHYAGIKDTNKVNYHIIELMKLVNYPKEADQIINLLKSLPLEGNMELANLLLQVSNQYNAYEFFEKLMK